MAGAASAHQAATASHEETSQQRAVRTRRTSADPQRARQGATAAAAAAPAALDSLSRLQQLANASPQVAQLRRLQALADARSAPVAQLAGLLQRRVSGGTGVIQLFDAGEGGKWHIHFEHMKLGTNTNSRVNFNGKTKKAIRRELGENINRYGLNIRGDLEASFRECINYINRYY